MGDTTEEIKNQIYVVMKNGTHNFPGEGLYGGRY